MRDSCSLAKVAVAAAAEQGRPPSLDSASASRRVLIVDDVSEDRCAMRWFAESCGYAVREASSLPETTALMREWEPDALVLDIVMPDSDGFETMRRLRFMHCRCPLLLVTGCHRLLAPAYNLGVTYGLKVVDVIGKPLDARHFKAKLHSAFFTGA